VEQRVVTKRRTRRQKSIDTKPSTSWHFKLDRVTLASARAQLHARLIAVLESSSETGWGRGSEARTAAFEAAMVEYAGTILRGAAQKIEGPDADSCLEQLRKLTIVGIVEWILPGEEYVEHEPASGFSDMSPQGEWELRLDEAYGVFRPQRAPATTTDDEVDAAAFRLYHMLRLRLEPHRARFRRRLEAALPGALLAIEPSIRERLPERLETSSVQTLRKRGFPANAPEHQLVVDAVRRIGPDWVARLSEICDALEGRVRIPRGWHKRFGCDSWKDVADMVEGDSQARSSLVKHIRYRIDWCDKNSSAGKFTKVLPKSR